MRIAVSSGCVKTWQSSTEGLCYFHQSEVATHLWQTPC